MTIQTFTAGQRLTALQMNTLQASGANFTRNVRNDLTYTFALSDKGKLVESTNAGAAVFTIANDSSVEFAIGDRIDVLLASIGSITISPASGVTLYAEGDITTVASAWTRLTLIKRAENSWVMTGTGMSVQTVELDNLAVTTAKIANLNVTTGKIADDAVNGDKIADSSITSAHIVDGTIVNGDVSASAAIAYSKLNLGTSIVNADVSASANIVDTKLNTISTAGKVANSATTATSTAGNSTIVARDGSGNFAAGTITAALSGNATTVTNGVYTTDTGTVTNAMLAGSIADSKLSTISTSGKVSNSATTATNANTVSTIVARDASGNFTAGTITASLTGTASNASKINNRTVFVQTATPTAIATGDIWFQVAGF